MRDLMRAQFVARRLVVAAALCALGDRAESQPVQLTADRAVWELASWPGVDSSGAPLTQLQTREDWFYSITQSRTALGVQDGFVAAGYSQYPDVQETACRTCPAGVCSMGTISGISAGGGVEWFHHNDMEGAFWRVIDTSDGGFLAVGHSWDRSVVAYNPVTSVGGQALLCGPARLIIVAKYAHDGSRTWQYAYGAMDDPDEHRGVGTGQLQERQDNALGAVELPGGGYRVVGHAVDPDHGMNPRAFVLDLDEYGGVEERRTFGQSGKRSEFRGVAISGDDFVVVGVQYNGPYSNVPGQEPYGDVFVMLLGEDLSAGALAEITLGSSGEVQDVGYDVAVAGDGSIHVAAVIGCEPINGHGDCFRTLAGGTGEAVIYQLDPADLDSISTTTLGGVLAYDLFVRLTELSDGRVGFVSTVQPTTPNPLPNGWEDWWYTDALVGILAENGEIDWWTQYDARTSLPYAGGYEKNQECLYDIAEAEDGGLVVAGNNSSNYDDNYVVRFAPAAAPALPAPTVTNSHLVFPVLGLVPNSLSLTGNLEIGPSGRLWIDTGRELTFGESDTLVARGELRVTDATLTATDDEDGWPGIVAVRDSVVLTGGLVEYAATALSVLEQAKALVRRTTLARSKLGLGVFSAHVALFGATIEENATGIETDYTAPYDGPPACLVNCPSFLSIDWDASTTTRTRVRNNEGDGVIVLNASAEILRADIENNGGIGVRLANASVSPFRQNVVAGNGGIGISVQAGGIIDLSLANQVGQNTVMENDGTELFISVLGDGFVGDDDANGQNDIVDNRQGAGLLVSYQYDPQQEPTAFLAAEHAHWGYPTTGGPPGNRVQGEVDAVPSLECPFASPGCMFGPGGGGSAGQTGSVRLSEGGPQARGDGSALREYRGLLAANPTDERAAGWIRILGSLHWHDRDDATGERAATFDLLAALSEPVRTGHVAPGYRPAAEAALEVRALAALRWEEYALSRDLVALVAEVENREVRRRLSLVDAFLDAQRGAYAEAAATLEVASEGTSSAEEASELLAISRSFATRALARPQQRIGFVSGAAATAGVAEARLQVSPNPTHANARIALTLNDAGRVRVSVHDVLGRLVLRIAAHDLAGGTYQWSFRASDLPAGTYLVRAEIGAGTGELVRTARFTVAR